VLSYSRCVSSLLTFRRLVTQNALDEQMRAIPSHLQVLAHLQVPVSDAGLPGITSSGMLYRCDGIEDAGIFQWRRSVRTAVATEPDNCMCSCACASSCARLSTKLQACAHGQGEAG
jgi:hypothetical protein